MNKSKFIAATITTLILFAIVRTFSPAPVDSEDKGLEAVGEEALVEDDGELETLNREKLEVSLKPKQGVEKLQTIAPVTEPKEVKANTDMSDFFSKKSDYVYFKVEDGLALIGGDIVLGEVAEEQKGDLKNRLLKDKPAESKLWETSEIPYGFSEGFPEDLKTKVLEAVKYFNEETVMTFIPVDVENDEDVIVFKFREGAPCSSYLGRVGGLQPVYLRSSCGKQDVMHELMHALGFVHEQQREERDRHIEVLWPNIDETFQYNFAVLPDSLVHQYEGSVFNVSLKSVMMYHDEAFAKPGMKSLKSKSNKKISPINSGLAEIDKERLEMLYGR